MRRSTLFGIIAVIFMMLAVLVLPHLSGWSGWPFVLLVVVAFVFTILIHAHARSVGYLCPACGHAFAISAGTDFLSPHFVGKLLRCPRCGEVSWCNEVNRNQVAETAAGEMPLKTAIPSGGSLYLQIGLVIAVYAGLWFYTFSSLPSVGGAVALEAVFRIPVAAVLLILLHFLFCHFAARQGYRGLIYPIMTLFVLAFLGLTFWMQSINLSHLAR